MNIKIYQDAKIIEKFSPDLRGVLTSADLSALLSDRHPNSFYRRISQLEKIKVIQKFVSGIYITSQYDLDVLSQKLAPQSYLSFDSILAKHLIIGTIPRWERKALKLGKKREYHCQNNFDASTIKITHFGLSSSLFFGFETIQGVQYATKEKALLDTLYFYQRGYTFYFDIYTDINFELIDRNIFKSYLRQYKNPKFIKFVENIWAGSF